jgi:hypothetical protein
MSKAFINLRVHPAGKLVWIFEAVMPAGSFWQVATLVMGVLPTKEPSAQPDRDQIPSVVKAVWRGEISEGALRAAAKRVVRVAMVYCILKLVLGAWGS